MVEFAIQAFATLIGAAAAFGLEALRRYHERQQTQIEQFKSALFVLLLQRTFLRTLHVQKLLPFREHHARAYFLQPILVTPSDERFDLHALSFLLSTKEAELLNNLGVAEAQYRCVVGLVEQRNHLHLAFQHKVQATGASEGTFEDIKNIAGKMLGRQLEDLTDELYRTTEHAIGFNRDVYTAAVSSFRRLFPKSSMFGVEDLPLTKSSASTPAGKSPESNTGL